jgi:hypothetical protein
MIIKFSSYSGIFSRQKGERRIIVVELLVEKCSEYRQGK